MIAGPLYGEEGIVAADCDLRLTLRPKRWFDPVGHYSREDALLPLLGSDGAEPAATEPTAEAADRGTG